MLKVAFLALKKYISHMSQHLFGQNDYLHVKNQHLVTIDEYMVLYTEDGPIELKIDHVADFATVPEKYHEIFLNMLSSKYLNKVSFTENPFSQCKRTEKTKWWEFWKLKIKI